MKRALVIVVAGVLGFTALCSPALASDRAADASAAARAAAWLDARAAAVHASPSQDAPRLARETILEIHARLETEGLDSALADALAPPPAERASPGRDIHLLEDARRRLRAFARASAKPLPPAPAEARAEMERILQDPAFDLTPQATGPLGRLGASLRSLIFRLLSTVMEVASTHATLVMVIVIGIIVAALVAVILKLVHSLGGRPRKDLSAVRASHPVTLAVRDDPRLLLEKARELAAAGRGRPAMRLLEAASVVALRERGEIPLDPGLTDLEAVRWLTANGREQIRAPFERLTSLHDGIVYGGREAAVQVVEDAARLAHSLVSGSPETVS